MHPVPRVLDAVEVVDRHLRVALLESLEVPLVVIVRLFPVDVFDWLAPLLGVVLDQVVLADVVVALEGQQLQVDQPGKAALVLEDVRLEQRGDVLGEGVLVDVGVDCAQLLLEVDAVELLQHVARCLVGRIIFDWVGRNVDDDHPVDARLDSSGGVPLCELHQRQSAH